MYSLGMAPWVHFSYTTRPSVWPWHPNSMAGNQFSTSMQGLTNQRALIKLADTFSTERTKQTSFHHRIPEDHFKLNWVSLFCQSFTAERLWRHRQNMLRVENCIRTLSKEKLVVLEVISLIYSAEVILCWCQIPCSSFTVPFLLSDPLPVTQPISD